MGRMDCVLIKDSVVRWRRVLEAEIFRLDPDGLSFAVNDHRQTVSLVAEHSVPDALLEGLADQLPLFDEDSVYVFLCFGLHLVP